jgi:mannose-6-phosphate isomerase
VNAPLKIETTRGFEMLYPLTFRPVFKERVWGGRNIERIFGKKLPAQKVIGESWEISDRPGDASVISNGPLAGKELHWLVENHREELLGSATLEAGRFPLLIKILDAQEKLSLQVHPPASKALELKGDPKTEMWYIVHAEPEAELYVGLKRGVTKAEFERKVKDGSVADCFHRIPVRAGDAMFLPSGRVHAIGAGLVIFEIQQNSDTTYRVFDWNRVGLDGKPRELHVEQSLASIDFGDFEPALVQNQLVGDESLKRRQLVHDPLFNVEYMEMAQNARCQVANGKVQILGCVSGNLKVDNQERTVELSPGEFCVVPASLKNVNLVSQARSSLLRAETN